MIVKNIVVSYSRKYGMPEYSSMDVFSSMSADVESFDLPEAEIADSLLKVCRKVVCEFAEKELKEFYSERTNRNKKLGGLN